LKEWSILFDSSLQSLLGFDAESLEDPAAKLYLKVLIAYFSGDLQTLQEHAQTAEALSLKAPLFRPVYLLTNLRLQIRKNQVDPALIDQVESEIDQFESFWKGEIHFVLSSAEAVLERHDRSRDQSLRAFHALKQLGSRKKAVRALMNAVSSESCRRPDKLYFADLHFLHSEAQKIGDTTSQGITQLNISREYQKLGLFRAALRSADRAVSTLSHITGGIDYPLALAHRAHIFCQLGAWNEARLDTELACSAPFPEVKAAIRIIQIDFPKLAEIPLPAVETAEKSAIPAWSKRAKESMTPHATKLEEKLIQILAHKSHSREQICERLYGKQLAPEVTRNRLNNLMNRVRKKHPSLIKWNAGKYRLTESTLLPIREARPSRKTSHV